MAGWTAEQVERAAKAFAAFEEAERNVPPGKPRYVHPTWAAFCETIRTIRAEQVTSASRVADPGWWTEFWHGEVGSKLPPVGPALKRFAWSEVGILLWGVPAAVFGGVIASRFLHSSIGKSVVRSSFHAALWALVLGPILGHAVKRLAMLTPDRRPILTPRSREVVSG
jgi:hypothetical protein